MIKCYSLLPKRPDVSTEYFHEHWRTVHADHAKKITTLKRYVQAHRIDASADGLQRSPFEGTAEVWYDDLGVAVGMADDPNYTENAQPDEPNFIDMKLITFVMTEEQVFEPGPDLDVDAPGVKLLVYVKRPAGSSLDDFRAKWLGVASGLLPGAEGVRRSTGALALLDTYGGVSRSDELNTDEPYYDGAAEFSWEDLDSFRRDWAAEGAAAVSAIGQVSDSARSHGDLVEENRVIWPA